MRLTPVKSYPNGLSAAVYLAASQLPIFTSNKVYFLENITEQILARHSLPFTLYPSLDWLSL